MQQQELLTRFLLQLPPASSQRPATAPLKAAAVLIPVVARHQLQLLLTQRSRHLRHHPSQICFPGGKQDPSDPSLIHTALRETQEELGIAAQQVEVIGTLPQISTVSRYQVLPILGLIRPNYQLTLNRNEVARAFEIPLSYLLDQQHHYPLTLTQHSVERTLYWIPYQQDFIWGATASMIHQLSQQLSR